MLIVSVFFGERLSPTFIAILFPYCKLLLWILTGYCVLGNISQNAVCHFYSDSID